MSASAWGSARPPESSSAAAGRSPSRRHSVSDNPESSFRPAAAGARTVARHLRPVLAAALLALPLLSGLSTEAAAQVECSTANSDGSFDVPDNWALKPSGVAEGGSFRLLFITSTTHASSSTDIATYNEFVQTRAKAGHSAISDSCGDRFKVVGSTSAVDARDNTDTTGTGVPIYWLNGNKLADDYTDFYDGSWADFGRRDESGGSRSFSEVLTGTDGDGTKFSGYELGGTSGVGTGSPTTGGNPLQEATESTGTAGPYYALSPVFKVPQRFVSMSTASQSVSEGDAVRITLVMTGTRSADTSVQIATFDGNGTAGTDYTAGPYTVTIAAGQTEGHVDVPTIDNGEVDGSKTFLGRLHAPPSGVLIGTRDSVVVTITDNDKVELRISPASPSVAEGGSATLDVKLGSQPSASVTVSVASDNDDVTVTPASLTFTTSNWDSPQQFTVSAGEDDDQSHETATLTLDPSSTDTDYNALSSSTVSVTVVDNDNPASLMVTPTSLSITEGGGGRFAVYLASQPSTDVRVAISSDNPDVTTTPTSLTFTSSNWNRPQFVMVDAGEDEDQSSETATLTLDPRDTTDPNYNAVGDRTVTVAVGDNDVGRPTITMNLAGVPSSIAEGETFHFELTVNHRPQKPTGVSVTLASPSGAHYVHRESFTTFYPSGPAYEGRDATTKEIWVRTVDDSTDEPTGPLTVSIAPAGDGSYEVGSPSSFEVEVRDNDLGPEDGGAPCIDCVWMEGGGDITEGATAAFTLHAHPAPLEDLEVVVSVHDAPGTYDPALYRHGADFLARRHERTHEVTIPAGSTSVSLPPVPTWDDSTDEPDGHVWAVARGVVIGEVRLRVCRTERVNNRPVQVCEWQSHREPSRYRVRTDPDGPFGLHQARVNVSDNDGAPDLTRTDNVSFALSMDSIREDAADPWVDINVSLSSAQPRQLDYSLCIYSDARRSRSADQTGADRYDYRIWVDGRIATAVCPHGSFAPGATSSRMRIEVLDDSHEDSGETVRVQLNRAFAETWEALDVGILSPWSRTLVINNDEGRTDTHPADHPLTKYATVVKSFYDRITARHGHGDGASGGWNKRFLKAMGHPEYVDYPQAAVTVADATRIWNSGGNAAWDGTVEAVTYAERYFAGQVTPPPPDPVPVPAVSVAAGADVTEGGSASFTLSADPVSAAPLDVSVTVDATGDYGIAAGTQTVTIPTTGSATLTLATTGDDTDEADGSVSVTVDAGTGYTVGTPSSGTVAIADDDAPALPAAHPVMKYAPLVKTFYDRITANHQHGDSASGGWNKRFLKAMGHPEYVNYPQAAVTVQDATRLWNHGGPGANTAWNGTVEAVTYAEQYFAGQTPTPTPTPDPVPDPAVSIAAGSGVTEGGSASFVLTAAPAPSAPLDVTVTVAATGDYGITAGTQTVTIPTTGAYTLTLATTNDDADEPDGSVSATVDAGTGYTVGAPSSGTVAIADDDLPPPVVSVAAGAGITEGGDAVFTVTADRAVAANLAVTLTVSEAAGSDFVAAAAETAHTVTLEAGKRTATLTVATDDDTVDEPDGSVTATLSAGTGYTVAASSNAASVAVSDNDAAPAVASLSIDDATGPEGTPMLFTIRLSAPSDREVQAVIKSRESTPASARAGPDFVVQRYHVTFRPGETVQRRGFFIRDDSHDDGGETFEVYVSWSDGVPIADGVGVGTITNADPLPAAYLARFGRTVAEAALDGIAGRMAAPRTPGMQGSIAGQALGFGPTASGEAVAGQSTMGAATPGASGTTPMHHDAALAMADIASALGADASAAADPFGERFGTTPAPSRSLTAREALLGSSFTLTGAEDASGGSLAFWGRASQGRFDGAERGDGTDITLDGEVTTGMLGADYARGDWLLGLALTQSEADGGYVAEGEPGCPAVDGEVPERCDGAVRAGDGEVEASLTAAIPYAAVQASERLKLWGAAGYGSGEVTLKTAMGDRYEADTSWSMAAAGLRGALLEAPTEGSGPALALTSDALWARTSSDKTRDLVASDSDVTRLRLGLEGSYRMALDGDGSLTPKVEIGARHDGGDAETGFGVELGGGLKWVAPQIGLSLDVSGRTLLAHENDDLEDRGISAALGFDPNPATERGLSLSLRQALGGQASGGLDALFATDPLEDRTGSEATSRWTMEAAYGFPVFGSRFTGSPHIGLGLSPDARDYRLGWRLTPEGASAPDLSFGVEVTLRESDTQAPEHRVGVEVRARW